MDKKQKETLMKLFKEQQKLNLELFNIELLFLPVDYKAEKLNLELAIHNSKEAIKSSESLRNMDALSESDE